MSVRSASRTVSPKLPSAWRDQLGGVERLGPDQDLAVADPGDVEQVVDELAHVAGLPLDDRGQLAAVGSPPDRSAWAAPRIAARGLRSSWASTPRNSSLRRSASCRARSARRRSETSIVLPTTRVTRPVVVAEAEALVPDVEVVAVAVADPVLEAEGGCGSGRRSRRPSCSSRPGRSSGWTRPRHQLGRRLGLGERRCRAGRRCRASGGRGRSRAASRRSGRRRPRRPAGSAPRRRAGRGARPSAR